MPRVGLYTLGCKVNQYETEKIAEEFSACGFDVVNFSVTADIYVINSCTVTHTADGKSRAAVRAAVKRNPAATVVITGCYAETSPDEAGAIDGVDLVIGNSDKAALVSKAVSLFKSTDGGASDWAIERAREWEQRRSSEPESSPSKAATEVRGRTRALLKVQDGCDQFCSYCAVPLARSTMTSKPFQEVIAEAEELASREYKEIVLTGIRLGRYEDGGADLADLLRALTWVDGIQRIRLSSIEVTDIPTGLLSLMASNPKICRHLHIPLQSGDDDVLCRMNRPYSTKEFAFFARNARSMVPGIAITTDIIVGYPGETAAEFDNTLSFAREMRFSKSHIFRYSPRRGTFADGIGDDVSPAEKEERRARLIELSGQCTSEFMKSLVGQQTAVLVEGKTIDGTKRSGLTDTYVRVVFEAGDHLVRKIVNVHVEKVINDIASGKIIA